GGSVSHHAQERRTVWECSIRRGDIYWIKYYSAGRPIRESTGTTKEKEAKRILKEKEGRSAAGLQPLPRIDRITYDELAHDLRLHYETTGTRELKEADTRLEALRPFFTGRRVASIKGALAEEYVQHRLQAGVTPPRSTENSRRSSAC
ncbi:MAG: hypothetical protein ACREJN_22115, partial [Nitrospiraceae bacterium]